MGEHETNPVENSLVRIRTESRKIVGAGFLADNTHVVTCAHVVIAAWKGLDKNKMSNLALPVYIDFPFIEPGKIVTAKVALLKNPKTEDDIAYLTLESPKPSEAKPPPLKISKDYWKHEFRVYGFPEGYDKGKWATGILQGPVEKSLLQIEDIKVPGVRVKQGFSGTPVWDAQLEGVVGMVTEEDTAAKEKVAYIIPSNVLGKVLPELDIQFVRVPAITSYSDQTISSFVALLQPFITAPSTTQLSPAQSQNLAGGVTQLLQPLPSMTDLFTIIRDPADVPNALFQTHGGLLTPYDVPYIGNRKGTADVQKDVYTKLLDSGGKLLIQSRAGLGKTLEVSKAAENHCRRGWTVCVAKRGDGDRSMNRLAAFPEELRGDRLLLIFDDLHQRVRCSKEGQEPYVKRVEGLLAYLDQEMMPSDIRVLGTMAIEPHYQKQLRFDPSQLPWKRFGVYNLPEFTLDNLEHILTGLAERAKVDVERQQIGQMVANSDRTLSTLFENVRSAWIDKQKLTMERWMPSRGELWEARFRNARGLYRDPEAVYQALQLFHEAGLPARLVYILQMSSSMANVDTRATIDGLIDDGLLGLYLGVLETFGNEQLVQSLRAVGSSILDVNDNWDAIVEAVTKVSQRPSEWYDDYMALSRRLIDADQFGKAILITDAAIMERPDEAAAYFFRSLALNELGNKKGAEADLTAAINRGKEDDEIYLLRAIARFQLGDHAGADADLKAASEHKPDDAGTLMLIGVIRYIFKFDLAAAEVAYNRAIECGQDDFYVYYFRGYARMDLGNKDGAEADFSAAIERDPNDASAYYARSRARDENRKGAEEDLTAAIDRGMENQNVYFGRGLVRTLRENYAGAEEDFTKAIERGMDNADVYYCRGVARRAKGDFVDAEADFTEAIKRGYTNAEVYHSRGLTRREQQNHAGAEADFTEAIKRGYTDPEVYYNRAKARAGQANPAGAEEDLTKAIERGMDNADVYCFRGLARHKNGDFVDAEADYTEAIKRGYTDAYIIRSEVRESMNNLEGAGEDLNAAISQGKGDRESYSRLGLIMRRLGRWQEAIQAYRNAVALDNFCIDNWVGLAASARESDDTQTWQEALERARQLLDKAGFYSSACFYSVAGEADKALELLQQALKEQPDLTSWARKDPDLHWLRNDPRFDKITNPDATANQQN